MVWSTGENGFHRSRRRWLLIKEDGQWLSAVIAGQHEEMCQGDQSSRI